MAAALAGEGEARAVLEAFATGLLTLLVGERALALNRAAMTSPELAEVLLAEGRHSAGPLVEAYLARLAGEGRLALDDPAEAFRVLYGLVVQDTQIRALLGEPPPAAPALAAQARRGVERFLALAASRDA